MKKALLFLTFYFISVLGWASNKDDISLFLPKASLVIGEVSSIGVEPEIEKISQKMTKAMKDNSAWLESYLNEMNLKAGEILPYHENFGVSKDEYERLVAAAKKLKLIKIGEIKIEFMNSDDVLNIRLEGMDLPVNEFKIDLKQDLVQTSRAKLTEKSPIDQDDKDSPTGRWTGFQWQKQIYENMENAFSETFAIGRLKDEEKGIIYYDLKSSADGAAHFVIQYKLGAP